jgi:hypothetical protein
MDSSLHSANLTEDHASSVLEHAESEEGQHIHLPGPSLWPLILGVAILITISGLLFIPDAPWLAIIGAVFVLVGILGWGLEDPMAAPEAQFVAQPANDAYAHSRFKIGQEVVDKDGLWIGTVRARFSHYILAERSGLFAKALYVPQSVTSDIIKNNVVRLTVSETDLLNSGLDSAPDDLYDEAIDPGLPQLTGVPMFGQNPLSPAETGHYNYGPNSPGINTDAAGSYNRHEVVPNPQKYVGERRKRPVRSLPSSLINAG